MQLYVRVCVQSTQLIYSQRKKKEQAGVQSIWTMKTPPKEEKTKQPNT